MQNLIKLAMWMAPAFVLALIIILGRLDQNDAQIDTETARFDREFSQQQADFSNKKDFWLAEKEAADQRLKIAKDELALAKGKATQQLDILEKSIKEMNKKEDEK